MGYAFALDQLHIMSGPRVRRVEPPTDSLITDWYPRACLLDSYAVDLAPGAFQSMRALAGRAFGSPPIWFRALLWIRDGAVRPFGIKTSAGLRQANPAGDRVDFFPVLEETTDEIVLGENDRHLDFRLSLQRGPSDSGAQLVATTAVHVHNRLGRLYIAAIRPFHRMVVMRMMRRLGG